MPFKCCVRCCIYKKGTMLHSFPKENERFKIWCIAISREDLFEKDLNTVRKNFRVCDIHFDENTKYVQNHNRSNLKCGSVPTLYLPGQIINFDTFGSNTISSTSENILEDTNQVSGKLDSKSTNMFLDLPSTSISAVLVASENSLKNTNQVSEKEDSNSTKTFLDDLSTSISDEGQSSKINLSMVPSNTRNIWKTQHVNWLDNNINNLTDKEFELTKKFMEGISRIVDRRTNNALTTKRKIETQEYYPTNMDKDKLLH